VTASPSVETGVYVSVYVLYVLCGLARSQAVVYSN
jgi:hypothetical protein